MPDITKLFAEELGIKPIIKDTEECFEYIKEKGCNVYCKGYPNCNNLTGISAMLGFPFSSIEEFKSAVNDFDEMITDYVNTAMNTEKSVEDIRNAAERAIAKYKDSTGKI